MVPAPQTTGRYLVLLDETDVSAGIQAIGNFTGVTDFAHTADFEGRAIAPTQLPGATSLVLDDLGVAVVSLDTDQVRSLSTASLSQHLPLTIEPERVVYAMANPDPVKRLIPPMNNPGGMNLGGMNLGADNVNVSLEYLKGYRDAVHQLVEQLSAGAIVAGIGGESGDLLSPQEITWGLQRTRVSTSCYSGAGVRVAVLDTGLDLTHPDFVGRTITSKSFVPEEDVQDGNGHGTHCIGTACGSLTSHLPRYGVAYAADIFAGKVLSDEGNGSDGGILAGINWAIANGCQIISLSLGAPVQQGQTYSKVYEQVSKRSMNRGSLIIAAAGNDSWRQFGVIQAVSHPANCPSIMAVAALNDQLAIAPFSNGGLNARGGQIDIAAPGVDIYSAWPMPTGYNTISGTSMATPHVAGIAALFAEATAARGYDLWTHLTQHAQRLPAASRDVGSGLVQAI